MLRRGTSARALTTVTLVLTAAPVISPSPAAEAAPTALTATPRVATSGTPVAIGGGGCTTDVRVTGNGYLFPGAPSVPFDVTVTPAGDGTWAAQVPMPSVPTAVTATCDGATSNPVVITPTDAALPTYGLFAVAATTVTIATAPLVDGSELAVFTTGGLLLGAATATRGTAAVVLDRRLGPARVVLVALRSPDRALPVVPIAGFVDLPLAADAILAASPRVGPPGTTVTIDGACAGTARLVLEARATDAFTAPVVLADLAPPVVGERWSATLTMPDVPATATLRCTNGGQDSTAAVILAPNVGALLVAPPTVDDADIVAPIAGAATSPLDAFTADGRPVAWTLEPGAGPLHVRLAGAAGVGRRIVVVGLELLGENANARNGSRAQAWTIDVAGVPPDDPVTTTTTTTAPPAATITTTTATPAPVPAPATTVGAAAVPPTRLPATGTNVALLMLIAAVLVTGGAVALRLARRR